MARSVSLNANSSLSIYLRKYYTNPRVVRAKIVVTNKDDEETEFSAYVYESGISVYIPASYVIADNLPATALVVTEQDGNENTIETIELSLTEESSGGGGGSQELIWDEIQDKPNFANVAFSGEYDDLIDTPEFTERFRGEWSDSENLWVADLSSGLPTGITGSGTVAPVTVDKPSNPPSGSITSARAIKTALNLNGDAQNSVVTINMANVGQPSATGLKFYIGGGMPGTLVQYRIYKNGSPIVNNTLPVDLPWTEQSIAVDADDVITVGLYGALTQGSQSNPGALFYIAGIRATIPSGSPYMINEYVAHKGKIWRSNTNNNASTPGVANWEEVVSDNTAPKVLNALTGTSYTLALTDAGRFLTFSNASATTLTVPTNTNVAFPIGTIIDGAQIGAGQVTIAPAGGVTVNGSPGLKLAEQYASFSLIKIATNTWLAVGRLSV